MNKLIDVAQKQMLRGKVLNLCNELQATGAGVTLMAIILQKQGFPFNENDISEACYYLQSKELITLKNYKSDTLNTERDIAYITAAGIYVLESVTLMDGVILG